MTCAHHLSDFKESSGRLGKGGPALRRLGEAGRALRRLGEAGFTLTELMIGASLSVIVLAGVLSAFVMLGRSGMNAANYSVSESEIRRGIEDFAQDVRMASGITWNSTDSITLTVPNNYTSTSNKVTYSYDSGTGWFYRVPGDSTATTPKTVYVRNISSFTFYRYNRLDTAAANDAETKRIQLSMNVRRSGSTLVAANTTLVLASYILRNKITN